MKTIRTILATFGVTSLLYGLFALIAMRLNPAFTGRSIFQLFRDTGFVALVIGIGCVLSFVIMTIAIASFRDENTRKKREYLDDDVDDEFLEEETVPEERADEADESWSPEIKRKQRRALKQTEEPEEAPDLFADEDEEPENRIPIRTAYYEDEEPITVARTVFRDEPVEEPEPSEDEPVEEPEPAAEEPEESRAEPEIPTKRCIYCGNVIDADSAFCIYCGKRV